MHDSSSQHTHTHTHTVTPVQTMADEAEHDEASVSYHKVLEEREQDIKEILKDGVCYCHD